MCLAIPAKVISFGEHGFGTVEIGGVRREVSLELIDNIDVGDFVILHTGYALQKLDRVEAEKTLALFEEIAAGAEEVIP